MQKVNLKNQLLDNEHLKECLLKEKLKDQSNDSETHRNKIDVKELIDELNAVALEWKSSKNMIECKCTTTFDAFNQKVRINYLEICQLLNP